MRGGRDLEGLALARTELEPIDEPHDGGSGARDAPRNEIDREAQPMQTDGCGRGAPTQAESVFERTDGIVRFKLGPSTLTAGMSEPSLSQVTQVEWAGPLRPLGEVEIKKTIPVPGS